MHTIFTELLRVKYAKTKFYVHNLAGFDSVFIVKHLSLQNQIFTENGIKDHYYFETITRDKGIIKLIVKRVIDKRVKSVTLLDSYALLNSSLDNLSKSYNLIEKKTVFPYKFVSENTLFYVGNTPGIKFYNSISKKEYNKLVIDN